ncbi:MAG: ferric reductase-like transmembrane domain-containing protein [Thermoleophilia bacterium]
MKADPTWWLLARASGMTAYALLTASVLAGLLLKARPFGKAIKPATALEVHRSLSLLGLAALAVHGVTLVLDHAVEISLPALLVPGLAPYRPLWTGAGVVAGELMALVIASFWVRRRIGAKTWRRLHWLTYATFVLAAVHGLMAGTDSGQPWALGLYVGSIGAVAAATAWRALVPPARPTRPAPTPAAPQDGVRPTPRPRHAAA